MMFIIEISKGISKVTFLIIHLLFFIVLSTDVQSGIKHNATPPQRIISLSPPITEGLYLLGLENRIVGVTIYCQQPPRTKEKEKVGSVMEVNVEKIISLKPDLVLAMNLTSIKDIKKLKNLGINVVTFEIPKDYTQLCDVFLGLGSAVVEKDKADEIVKASKSKVLAIRKKAENLPKQKVFIQLGTKPLFAATKDYFVNDYIEFAGGINIFKHALSGLIGREEVIRRNPDVIFIASMGISGENEQKTWQKYKSINAVRKGRICIVDPDKICSPTPVSFVQSLEEIVEFMHSSRVSR